MDYKFRFQDGTIIQAQVVDNLSNTVQYCENGVLYTVGINDTGKTIFDKYDLDGNHWVITVSSDFNWTFYIEQPNGTRIINNNDRRTFTNISFYDQSKPYYFFGHLYTYQNKLHLGGHEFNAVRENRTGLNVRGSGLNGNTLMQYGSTVPFPNIGQWIAGTSMQRVAEFAIANSQFSYIYNLDGITPGSNVTYIFSSAVIPQYGPSLSIDQLQSYFYNTLNFETGSLDLCTAYLNQETYFYNGSALQPIPIVESPNGNILTLNVDYTLSYLDNVNIGTAQVIITGINLWSGTKRLYFTIVSGADPYSSGGISTTGGGDGSFDSTTDTITIPSLPTLSSLQSSLINLWAPSQLQLGNLVSWLWSSAFDLDSLKKLFANPMDMIMGLSIVPVSVPTTSDTVKFGLIDSNVSMYKVTQQYAIVDCGDVNLEPFWGSYLDYSPYTKLDIFLPYIGYVHLDPDVMMDSTINVTYHIDVLSGSCVAFICSNTSILYTFMGDCAIHIPISANDWSSLYTSLARLVSNSATFAIGLTTSMKPIIGKSGSISASGAFLNLQKPHLVINRPRQALPELQNIYTGYPAFITSPLTSLLGYTEVESIHLDNVPATDAEIDEILEILHNGFVI